jgi:alkylation response protein AidB-like acyl-CoA dehydrogenase
MDLEFTAEQEALRDGVRALLERECPATAVRELVEKGRAPQRLWPAQVETGWTALALPEDVGGLGLGAVEVALVAEEAGRAVAPGPWLTTTTQYAAAVTEAGSDEQAQTLLGPVAEGQVTGALALAEEPSGNPPTVVQTTARRDGDTWILNGTKYVVIGAEDADVLAVVAAIDEPSSDRLGVFIVATKTATINPVATVDRTRPWATVILEDTRADHALGAPGTSYDAIQRALQLATVALAAEIVGACAALVDRTIEYAKQREQFGVPIGSFQAVKHKLADDYVAVERARAAVYFAALTVAENDPRRDAAASMAKAAAGDCEHRVTEDAIQTHGGIGYTWEHDLQLWVKRAKANGALFGTAAWHRARLASLIGLPEAAS